jgi:hypothetical protein
MGFGGESALAAGVGLLALVSLPLIANAFLDVLRWESEPIRAVGAAAIVMGCLGMCGLVWGPMLGRSGWLVALFALVLLKIGLGLATVFTWRAFRPQSVAAMSATGALLALLMASLFLDLQTIRTDASYPEGTLGFRVGQLVTSLPFLWLGLESSRVRRASQRGDAPPAVAWLPSPRFGAWSLASAAFFAECQLALVGSLVIDPRWRDGINGARGLLYAAAAVCVYVAFYAPALAERRDRQRA